jgi:phage recombination protein Bet
MSNDLVTTETTMGMDRQIVVTADQMKTIKNVIFHDATDDELKLFIYHCQRKGVHPMDKLIHPIKRGGKVSFQASIDYLRAESESAGDYRGMKQPEFAFDEKGKLESATITVIREINGMETEFTATAYWDEFVPGPPNDFMWKKMPRHMLAKCAEALARRMAWPKKLADLYTPEEMAQEREPEQRGKPAVTQPQSRKTAKPTFQVATHEQMAHLHDLCAALGEPDEILKQYTTTPDGKHLQFDTIHEIPVKFVDAAIIKLESIHREQDSGGESPDEQPGLPT